MASIIGAAIAFAVSGAAASMATKYIEKNNSSKERDEYQKARDKAYDDYRAARDAYDQKLRDYQEEQLKRRADVQSADAIFISNDKLLNKYKEEFILNNTPPRFSDYLSTPPQKQSSNVWIPLTVGVSATVVGGMVLFALSKYEKKNI